MRQPSFQHLTGQAMWRHCDHHDTVLTPDPPRVMLAPRPSAVAAATDHAPWLAVRGAAASIPCPPDLCADAAVVLADPGHGLFALSPDGWRALPAPRPRIRVPAGGPWDFRPLAPPPPPANPIGIARDKSGRVWLLDRAPPRLRVLAPDFALIDTLPLPATATPTQVVASSWCIAVAAGGRTLLVQPFGGPWRTVTIDAAIVAIAADPDEAMVAVLLADNRLVTFAPAGSATPLKIPELTAPLFLLVTGPDTVLIGEPLGPPGSAAETRFISVRVAPPKDLEAVASFAVRGFDGRALWRTGDAVFASTAPSVPSGARALYPRMAPLATDGTVETYALDSEIFACVWHRVFVDACMPPGTSVTLEARTTDDLPPKPIRLPPRLPDNISATEAPKAAYPDWQPLISTAYGEPGWWPLGELDTRGAMADIPDPPERIARPSEDPFATQRSKAVAPWPQITLEGLIKAPPGRYLALRVRLAGTERNSPAVLAIRASFPRPSLLDHLPAYWRADPVTSDATDRALALFEGWITETDARVTALRELADPRLVPPEALDWLASYVALTFDQRVDEPVRRQLLSEASWLYERRGTVPGLTRMLSILARAPVALVEGFRLRRQAAVYLGQPDAIVGPGLQLGDNEGLTGAEDPADVVLEANHYALMLRRGAVVAHHQVPCPPADPPYPVETDPYGRFVRRFAHRFTVVLPCHRDAILEQVIDEAVEANKPAHTLHMLCWLDAGFRLGGSSLVGLARLGDTPCFEPGLLGTAVLGTQNTIGRYQPDTRFRPGQRLGRDGRLIPEGRPLREGRPIRERTGP